MTAELSYLYVCHDGRRGVYKSTVIQSFSERHHIEIEVPNCFSTSKDLLDDLEGYAGVILQLDTGWAGRLSIRYAKKILSLGLPIYFHWPNEKALEHVDQNHLDSFRRLLWVVSFFRVLRKLLRKVSGKDLVREISSIDENINEKNLVTLHSDRMNALISAATLSEPKNLKDILPVDSVPRVMGQGVYVRLNYWDEICSGGSVGHTAYVAKNLAERSERLLCITGTHYSLLEQLQLDQLVIAPPDKSPIESKILAANSFYRDKLRYVLMALKPAYVYERPVVGNYAVAELCNELSIPYFVEFNGSETSMKSEYGAQPYEYETEFLKAEAVCFKYASAINVISDEVRRQAVRFGGDPERILVNPNGADPNDYGPNEITRERIRGDFGFKDDDVVIGFIGTFGGWHGIDVLQQCLRLVCEKDHKTRFLMIGDGEYHASVVEAVGDAALETRVFFTGRVPQDLGKEYLSACDIFVSPHHKHIGNMKFFGSPTKLFEYMAMGQAIVASDFMQIGEVLAPSVSGELLRDLTDASVDCAKKGRIYEDISGLVGNERGVLVEPGNVEELASSILLLAANKPLRQLLGRNARDALLQHYTWEAHVNRFLNFAAKISGDDTYQKDSYEVADLAAYSVTEEVKHSSHALAGDALVAVSTNDYHKDQVQQQWDNNPCGSHYARVNSEDRKAWFEDTRRFRYEEYAPWKHKTMEFSDYKNKTVLEIGGGLGNDLSQYAANGALTTDFDLSSGHLALAKENFDLQGLDGNFIHGDAEQLDFDDASFDLVYSNGVIHHTPNTHKVVEHIRRILKPGAKAIIMVYAEGSIQFWRDIIWERGLRQQMLWEMSPGKIMSLNVEISENNAEPLVKVYSKRKLKSLFVDFSSIKIMQRQLMPNEVPSMLKWLPASFLQRVIGWNYIVKAKK